MLNFIFLMLTTLIWGFGFIATRWTFLEYDAFWSHALRFALAGVFSLPFLFYQKSFSKKNLLIKSYIGSWWLFGALFFQSLGLFETTVAKSGFITTLYALFTPMFAMIFMRKNFHFSYWVLVATSFVGVALLCNLNFSDFNRGDFLTLLCAMAGAGHILYIEKIADEIENAIEFNFLQSLFMGINSCILVYLIKGPVNLEPLMRFHEIGRASVITGLLYLSLLSSLVAFTLQVVSQKKMPSHIVSMVFLLESPIAAFFGYMVLDEKLNFMNVIGCSLILISLAFLPLVNKFRPPIKN